MRQSLDGHQRLPRPEQAVARSPGDRHRDRGGNDAGERHRGGEDGVHGGAGFQERLHVPAGLLGGDPGRPGDDLCVDDRAASGATGHGGGHRPDELAAHLHGLVDDPCVGQFPVSTPESRRGERGNAGRASGDGQFQRDPPAERAPRDVRALQSQLVKQAHGLREHSLGDRAPGRVRRRRFTVPRQVN